VAKGFHSPNVSKLTVQKRRRKSQGKEILKQGKGGESCTALRERSDRKDTLGEDLESIPSRAAHLHRGDRNYQQKGGSLQIRRSNHWGCDGRLEPSIPRQGGPKKKRTKRGSVPAHCRGVSRGRDELKKNRGGEKRG